MENICSNQRFYGHRDDSSCDLLGCREWSSTRDFKKTLLIISLIIFHFFKTKLKKKLKICFEMCSSSVNFWTCQLYCSRFQFNIFPAWMEAFVLYLAWQQSSVYFHTISPPALTASGSLILEFNTHDGIWTTWALKTIILKKKINLLLVCNIFILIWQSFESAVIHCF